MRHITATLVCVLLGSSVPTTAQDPRDAYRRVRPTQEFAWRVFQKGMEESPTFRALVDRLMQSDVIVYIQIRPTMRQSLGGSLRYVTTTPSDRYLQISLNPNANLPTLVALLGHELQHAVEVAEAPHVRSSEGLRMLYEEIGVRTARDTYDSEAAQNTGHMVRSELNGSRDAGVRMARHRSDVDLLASYGSIAAP